MNEDVIILSNSLLEKLKLTDNFRPNNYYSYGEAAVCPDASHANRFNVCTAFTKMFYTMVNHVKRSADDPMDFITLTTAGGNTSFSIKNDIIPFLKEKGQTIQLAARKKKTSFSAEVSNAVLLGDLLEELMGHLNTTIRDISKIFPENLEERIRDLPYLTQTNFWRKIISLDNSGVFDNIVIKTSDNRFDNSLFYHASSCTVTNRSYDTIHPWESYRPSNNAALSGKNYVHKTLICILENIYFYLSLSLCIYCNYLLGCGVLHNKEKDRHRVTIKMNNYYTGLWGIREPRCQSMFKYDRPSSFSGVLGLYWDTIDNVVQTTQENVVQLKSIIGSQLPTDRTSMIEAFAELDKIIVIFNDFKQIGDLLYNKFMSGSKFESLIKDSHISNSIADVFPQITQYIYNNFEGVDPKLFEKILFSYEESISYYLGSLPQGRSISEFKIENRPDINRVYHNWKDDEINTGVIITGSLDNTEINYNNYAFLDYWVNKADKPLIVVTKEDLPKESRISYEDLRYGASKVIIEYALFDKFNTDVDKYTGESVYTHPLNFKYLSSGLFPIISPGPRNIESLAKREITLQEKVAISLVYFSQYLPQARENDSWRQSSVPEFGIRVRY